MNLSTPILKVLGWQVNYTIVKPGKSVICVAPHTSNWDFILGKLFGWSVGLNAGFLMKKSWFVFPIGYLFRAMGGVPIDRSKRMSVTQQMVEAFGKQGKLHLAITPEGTRKPNPDWKKVFTTLPKVPVCLSNWHISIIPKEMGITEVFHPTDDEPADFKHIFQFLSRCKGEERGEFCGYQMSKLCPDSSSGRLIF